MIDPAYARSGAAPAVSGQGTPPSREEAEGKEDEFREAMQRDTEKNKPGDEGAETRRGKDAREEKNGTASPPFSGDALLRSLGGSYTPLGTQATASSAQNVPVLAAELAESILVNADNRATGGEVRITLKDSVLQDTEIILRQEGERLVVQLASGNAASLDALRRAQDDLRNKLLALGRDVSVEVLDSRNREDEGSSGYSDGRSRGLDYFSASER